MSTQNPVTAKIKLILDSLPEDLARGIVFSGLSLNPVILDKAIETALALNLMRALEKEETSNKAEKLVANAMENFQKTLDKKIKRTKKKKVENDDLK